MIGDVFIKELRETVLDLRFVIVTVLCLTVVPLGMFVAGKEYQQRLADYNSARDVSAKGLVYPSAYLEAEGFRQPSPLSVFATGLEPFLPERVVTSPVDPSTLSRLPGPQMVKDAALDKPQSLLFGRTGLLFGVSYIVSLAALILTFSTISGERESGTLRLMISNAVPRGAILVGKTLGAYVCLLVPFTLSLLVGLLALHATGVAPVLSGALLGRSAAIVAVTLLLLFCFVQLGVLGSALTRHSRSSMVFLLCAWAVLALVVPRLGPVIAEIVYPVESHQVVSLRERAAKEDLRNRT